MISKRILGKMQKNCMDKRLLQSICLSMFYSFANLCRRVERNFDNFGGCQNLEAGQGRVEKGETCSFDFLALLHVSCSSFRNMSLAYLKENRLPFISFIWLVNQWMDSELHLYVICVSYQVFSLAHLLLNNPYLDIHYLY